MSVCLSDGPILKGALTPITVDIDFDAKLNCKWAGNPPLTLTWTKKGSNMVRTEKLSSAINPGLGSIPFKLIQFSKKFEFTFFAMLVYEKQLGIGISLYFHN